MVLNLKKMCCCWRRRRNVDEDEGNEEKNATENQHSYGRGDEGDEDAVMHMRIRQQSKKDAADDTASGENDAIVLAEHKSKTGSLAFKLLPSNTNDMLNNPALGRKNDDESIFTQESSSRASSSQNCDGAVVATTSPPEKADDSDSTGDIIEEDFGVGSISHIAGEEPDGAEATGVPPKADGRVESVGNSDGGNSGELEQEVPREEHFVVDKFEQNWEQHTEKGEALVPICALRDHATDHIKKASAEDVAASDEFCDDLNHPAAQDDKQRTAEESSPAENSPEKDLTNGRYFGPTLSDNLRGAALNGDKEENTNPETLYEVEAADSSDQYETACGLLHKSLIQRNESITSTEKHFLASLISSLPASPAEDQFRGTEATIPSSETGPTAQPRQCTDVKDDSFFTSSSDNESIGTKDTLQSVEVDQFGDTEAASQFVGNGSLPSSPTDDQFQQLEFVEKGLALQSEQDAKDGEKPALMTEPHQPTLPKEPPSDDQPTDIETKSGLFQASPHLITEKDDDQEAAADEPYQRLQSRDSVGEVSLLSSLSSRVRKNRVELSISEEEEEIEISHLVQSSGSSTRSNASSLPTVMERELSENSALSSTSTSSISGYIGEPIDESPPNKVGSIPTSPTDDQFIDTKVTPEFVENRPAPQSRQYSDEKDGETLLREPPSDDQSTDIETKSAITGENKDKKAAATEPDQPPQSRSPILSRFRKNRVELSISGGEEEIEISHLVQSSGLSRSSASSLPTVTEREHSISSALSLTSSGCGGKSGHTVELMDEGPSNKKPRIEGGAADDVIRFDGWSISEEHRLDDDGSYPFLVLGTFAGDESAKPHVLSPLLMEAMRNFLPYSVSEQNYWMKFSLVRDVSCCYSLWYKSQCECPMDTHVPGASLITLLAKARASSWTVIAIETVEGDVFGSFTGKSWRKQAGYFGSGEAFLWRLKKSRWGTRQHFLTTSLIDSELEVYPYTGHDNMVQLCSNDVIAVGGGLWEHEDSPFEQSMNGVGLLIDSDLLRGESRSSATFGNPPLCRNTQDGFSFEIVNLEVWTLTPCITTEEAKKMEARKLLVEKNLKLL